MSIRETIEAQFSDLSSRAQAWAIRTKRVQTNQWVLREEGHEYDTVTADDAQAALSIAIDNVDRSNYSDAEGTIWIDVNVRNTVTGEEEHGTVTLEPDAPDCEDGQDHDWRAPYSVVGGCRENPGVHGHGGGVIIKEACVHCGCYRITDTWAQDPSTGEQGLTSTAYEDADDDSRAWLWRRLAARAQEVEVDAAYTIKRDDDDQTVKLVRDEDGESVGVTDDELRAVADSQSWAAIIEQLPEIA